MAVISFDETREWSSAGWVFETVLTKVLEKIPDRGPLHDGIRLSLDRQLNHWNAAGLTSDELRLLGEAIDQVLEDTGRGEGFDFVSDEFRESFIRKTVELKELIQRCIRLDA